MGWDHRTVLSGVSLTVHEHDFIAITGPNGGGKTTLLRIMLGLLKPMKGYVKPNIADLRIGYLPQKNMIDSKFPVVVRDVIMSGLLGIKGLSDDEKEKMYAETIEAMDLVEHAHRPIGLLSGGQLQRALLGRAIIAKPQLLVLDEPLSYIDKRFESRLYKLIEELAKTTTIVLVSHEMSTIAGMANRHFIVDVNLHECSAHHHFVRTDCDD
jgi:zinc transport system ATP-binding protein